MADFNLARIGAWVAVFCLILKTAAQSAQVQPGQKFSLVRQTIIVVSVEINGQGPFPMVLDTGTSTTLVDIALAQKLALPSVDRRLLNTITGSQALVRSSLSRIVFGGMKADNVEALVEDLAELRKLDSHIVGVIGQNVLMRFNYLIDYDHRSLQFESGSNPLEGLAGERIPFTVVEKGSLISAEISSSKRKVSLRLDSAATSLILFHKDLRAGIRVEPGAFRVSTVSGNGFLDRGFIPKLKIGFHNLRDLPVAFAPAVTGDMQRTEDGLLPTAIFHSVYINNRDGFVIFSSQSRH